MRRMWRIAGALCIAHVVLLFAGYSQQKAPNFGDSAAKIVSTYAGVSATKMYAGGFVVALAWLVLLAGVTLVAGLLRGSTEASGWFSRLITTAGSTATSVTLAGAYAGAGGAVYAAKHGYAPQVVAGLAYVSRFSDQLAMAAAGLCALAVGAAGLASRALPRWAAWAGVAVGVVGIVCASSAALLNTGNLLWLVWLVMLGVVLLRGPARSAATPVPADHDLASALS
ncbi:hypothetical protein I6A60_26520 [Frankia sp. AgB1.9]|uniref:hypothetical protein n=1 Tax=unclassified Frankia TaxID=2632575 RepID=UPI00193292B5|nr:MULTISPECIES: hypothetical protein [unclassified Frankia]MBL7494360.1 hypothetical protein [Frankia sp. AgW1.1]MBL7551392.1 hypothetical protein [Frankia sp. AgB1.9]MBL7620727.1 hypothetical protein [Frankia sp. AgB1.8]